MQAEGIILLVFIAALIAFVVFRIRYRLTCPKCRGSARRTSVVVGFLVGQGKKKSVSTATGLCLDCGHMWTLRNVHSRRPGIISVSKGTELRR